MNDSLDRLEICNSQGSSTFLLCKGSGGSGYSGRSCLKHYIFGSTKKLQLLVQSWTFKEGFCEEFLKRHSHSHSG